MDNEYYILEQGEKIGPFTTRELMDRPLEPDDVVLLPLETQGIPAYSLPEFTDYFKSEGIYYPTKENTAAYLLRLPAFLIDAFIITVGIEILAMVIIPQYMLRLQSIFTLQFMTDPKLVENLEKYRTELLLIQLVWFIVMVLYYTACESGKMRASVGKYIFGLAVVDELGYSLSFGQALKRNLGKVVYELASFVVGPFAYIFYLRMIWGDLHQAIHDRFAGCFIVKKSR